MIVISRPLEGPVLGLNQRLLITHISLIPRTEAASCRRIDAVRVAVGILRIRRRIRATSIPRGVRPPVIPVAAPAFVYR